MNLSDLPRRIRQTLEFMVENRRTGKVILNFNDGKLLSFSLDIQEKVEKGWPLKSGKKVSSDAL